MRRCIQVIGMFMFGILSICPFEVFCQQVDDVVAAFERLNKEPQVLSISNALSVPTKNGHLQGVQVVHLDGIDKLLISGSSLDAAYLLQVDLETRRSEKVITLMNDPYRHAGGIQVSDPYMVVGIEDNFLKTSSKVCFYNYKNIDDLASGPYLTIDRRGLPKRYTAGTSGLLDMGDHFLVLVSNWDSRNWDFYKIEPSENKHEFLFTFDAPDDWPSYQSINLVRDSSVIYAIGTFQKGTQGVADLIHISTVEHFEPIIKKVNSKPFNPQEGVDFSTAAGIQVDDIGRLYIWATQRDASNQIIINRFSEE